MKARLLFGVSLIICGALGVLGLVWPDALASVAGGFTKTVFGALDWFFLAATTGFLGLCLWLAFGRHGALRLGPQDQPPEFSTSAWLSMLFAAGMGSGLLFWGVAEPVTHFVSPPTGVPQTAEAARLAMVITNFHWGLHAWAVYGIGALALAFFAFRHDAPYLPGAPIRLTFKGRWVAGVANAADLIAVLAVAFGVAGAIAMGIMQFQSGLSVVTDWDRSDMTVRFVILGVLFISYTISASTSLDKGIKILSQGNMLLAILLLLFVLLAGPTGALMRGALTAVGDYVSALPELSLRSFPYAPDKAGWFHGWTLVYFVWWIAWAPFVGVFIARISRGRTIREFVLGVVLAPTLFSIIWFAIFGGAALQQELHGAGGLGSVVNKDVTLALFQFFEGLPGSQVLSALAIALLFVFLVTSVDSATYVLGMLTTGGSMNPPRRRKLAWGVALGALGGALLLSGRIDVIRSVAILGAIPFTFVMLLQVAALIRALRESDR